MTYKKGTKKGKKNSVLKCLICEFKVLTAVLFTDSSITTLPIYNRLGHRKTRSNTNAIYTILSYFIGLCRHERGKCKVIFFKNIYEIAT